jgi:succinate-acetate transporter protein
MDGAGESHVSIRSLPLVANPAPLGLAGFALTTFLLSASNAEWTRGTAAWIGYAFAYGGLCQLLAGMWEFRNKNVFGATAFSTYGGFWIGLGLYGELVAPSATAVQFHNDLGWILLSFAIFNTYMLLWSMFVNKAVFAVFLTLEITEIVLFLGNFMWAPDKLGHATWLLEAGGIVGIVTALVAWYTSAAGVVNEMSGRAMLPVGTPMSFEKAAPAA